MILHICDMMTRLNRSASAFLDAAFGSVRWAMLLVPAFVAIAQPVRAETHIQVTEEIEPSVEADQSPSPEASHAPSIGQYGPFRVVSAERAELVDGTDSRTPQQFRAMMAAHPQLRQIDMIECPGSEDDDANLELGRMIRQAGLVTHVPSSGSIRSGGVELFLAGTRRIADRGAEIAVHSWKDSDGLEATDYPASDPVHAPYLSFYRDMGMPADTARAFYDFTNHAASFDDLHDMTGADLQRYGLVTG